MLYSVVLEFYLNEKTFIPVFLSEKATSMVISPRFWATDLTIRRKVRVLSTACKFTEIGESIYLGI